MNVFKALKSQTTVPIYGKVNVCRTSPSQAKQSYSRHSEIMENNCERKIVETIQRDQKRWNSGPSQKCESPITKLLSLKAFYFEFAFQLLTTTASEQKMKIGVFLVTVKMSRALSFHSVVIHFSKIFQFRNFFLLAIVHFEAGL